MGHQSSSPFYLHHVYPKLAQVTWPQPSHLPPRTIPLGHLSAPAPSIQYHALNLDWRFVSYMILYMFQCHSPNLSHPLPLPMTTLFDPTVHFFFNASSCLFSKLALFVFPPLTNGSAPALLYFWRQWWKSYLGPYFSVLQAHPVTTLLKVCSLDSWCLQNP